MIVKKFKITPINCYDFKYRNYFFLNNIINNYNYKIHVFLYFLKILKEIKNRNYDYIFVRDYYLLYLFYKFNYNLKHIIFEIHSLPKGKLFSNIIKNVFLLNFYK